MFSVKSDGVSYMIASLLRDGSRHVETIASLMTLEEFYETPMETNFSQLNLIFWYDNTCVRLN